MSPTRSFPVRGRAPGTDSPGSEWAAAQATSSVKSELAANRMNDMDDLSHRLNRRSNFESVPRNIASTNPAAKADVRRVYRMAIGSHSLGRQN